MQMAGIITVAIVHTVAVAMVITAAIAVVGVSPFLSESAGSLG